MVTTRQASQATTKRARKSLPRTCKSLPKASSPSPSDGKPAKRPKTSSHDEADTEKDPWVIAYEQNFTSVIYRLPEDIAERIMTYLLPAHAYTLRQSCRLFMRLFEGREFDRLRMDPRMPQCLNHFTSLSPPFLKRGIAMAHLSPDESSELKAILQRESFCLPCRTAMESGARQRLRTQLKKPMYCGGCRQNHPKMLFSVAQRRVADDTQRICIGREGHVRICQHKMIFWRNVEQVQNAPSNNNYDMHFRCNDSSHDASQKGPGLMRSLDPPSATLQLMDEAGWIRLGLSGGHISLHVKLNSEPPPTLQQVQRTLMEAATTASLCPHESFDDMRLLRTFDPSRCACIPQSLPVTHSADECFIRPGAKFCCICSSNPRTDTINGVSSMLSTNGHTSDCSSCDTRYEWETADDGVRLKRRSWASLKTPSSIKWVQLLDKESYQLEEPKSRHVLWCDTPGCATTRQWRQRLVFDWAAESRWGVYPLM